jgi:hypothetical protein
MKLVEPWYHSPEWWLVVVTVALVIVTGVLAVYTAFLWRTTRQSAERQSKELKSTLAIARTSAEAASKQANASIASSAPFLYPRVREKENLYPPSVQDDNATHLPSAWLYFENIGRSPALLKGIAAKFFLVHRDELPELAPPMETLPLLQSSAIIGAGDEGGGKTWQFDRLIDANEIRQLLASVSAPHWLRFYLIGYIVYDDVFQIRHTQRFCIKVRRRFQAMKGGPLLNEIAHSEAHADEPGEGEAE